MYTAACGISKWSRPGSARAGNANIPWLYKLGFTRNTPTGLYAEFDLTFTSDLNGTRSTFSLMQGVNDFWPAVTFSINPSSTSGDPQTFGIDI